MEKKTKKSRTIAAYSEYSVRLGAFRKFIKLTQEEVGQEFGVDQSMIYKYERGLNVIPFELPKFYHDKYKMNYEWFYDNVGPMITPTGKKSLMVDTTQLLGEMEQMKHELTYLKRQMLTFGKDFYEKQQKTKNGQFGDNN